MTRRLAPLALACLLIGVYLQAQGVRLRTSGTVAADATAPNTTLSTPASCPHDAGTASSLAVAGSATDNVLVAKVTWANAGTGGSGEYTTTGAWSGTITLANGTNALTFTAYDSAGNTDASPVTCSVTTVISGGATVLFNEDFEDASNCPDSNPRTGQNGGADPTMGATTPNPLTDNNANGACQSSDGIKWMSFSSSWYAANSTESVIGTFADCPGADTGAMGKRCLRTWMSDEDGSGSGTRGLEFNWVDTLGLPQAQIYMRARLRYVFSSAGPGVNRWNNTAKTAMQAEPVYHKQFYFNSASTLPDPDAVAGCGQGECGIGIVHPGSVAYNSTTGATWDGEWNDNLGHCVEVLMGTTATGRRDVWIDGVKIEDETYDWTLGGVHNGGTWNRVYIGSNYANFDLDNNAATETNTLKIPVYWDDIYLASDRPAGGGC